MGSLRQHIPMEAEVEEGRLRPHCCGAWGLGEGGGGSPPGLTRWPRISLPSPPTLHLSVDTQGSASPSDIRQDCAVSRRKPERLPVSEV